MKFRGRTPKATGTSCTWRTMILAAALSAAVFPAARLHAQQRPAPAAEAAKPAASAAVSSTKNGAAIRYQQGLLTFHAQNQTLGAVLRQVAQLTGVAIHGAENLGDKTISVDLEQFRLDEALRQILNGYDAFFLYAAEDGALGESRVKAVWVYPARQALGLAPAAGNAWAAKADDMRRMLLEPDPNVRARAIDAIIRRTGRESAEAVQAVLKDDDDTVRITALNRALNSGVQIPQEVLINLALYDSSANIRFLALQALPVDPTLRWVAERAAQDESTYVSRAAQGIVGELDSVASPGGN